MKLKLLDAGKARAFGMPVGDTTTEALIQKFTEQWHDAGRAQAHVDEAIRSKVYVPLEDWEAWFAEQQRLANLEAQSAERSRLELEEQSARVRLREAQEAYDRAAQGLKRFSGEQGREEES